MAHRAEAFLHRWLPIAAVAAAAVFVATLVLFRPLIGAWWAREINAARAAVAAREPVASPTLLPALVTADARSVLDRAAQAAVSLDGDPQVLESVAQIVATNDTIQRLWIANDRGAIVYFGRERPSQSTVEKLAPALVHRLLEGLPRDLLTPEQRLAILLHAAVLYEDDVDSPRALHERFLRSRDVLHSEVRRIPGGWVAVAAAPPRDRVSDVGTSPGARVQLLSELNCRMQLLSFVVYWLSLPVWVTLDALRRGERAPLWGVFTLIANVVGLIVYLLARRET